jgi:hypothetical protein
LEKLSQRQKKLLKWLLKLLLSGLAIYLVSRKIDFQEVFKLFPQLDPGFIVLAVVFFNISKVISAVRYRLFVQLAGADIDSFSNLRLYYIGMFYNLFLPGGIGGDGYKIYLLNKYSTSGWKELTWATIVERFSGLAALLGLLLAFLPFSEMLAGSYSGVVFSLAGFILPFLGLWVVLLIVRKRYVSRYGLSSLQSFGVQFSQVICAVFILMALSVDHAFIDYLVVFLASSVVAVIPFTIGGVGARELVFVYAGDWLNINIEIAVAFSLIFFLITALSSLVGVFFEFKQPAEVSSSVHSKS